MTNWFDEEIKESIKNDVDTPDINNIESTLKSLGFDTSNIVIKLKDTPIQDNIGKRACVKNNIVVASNILIKTNYNLYKVSQVILPKGYLGVISGVEDGKYRVDFDANLPINSGDITDGFDGSNLTYPLDSYLLSSFEVQLL